VELPPTVHIRHTFDDLKNFDTITPCKFQMALINAVVHNRGSTPHQGEVNKFPGCGEPLRAQASH